MSKETNSILIGLIGSGLDGSLSPAMHEREGDQQGLRYIYKRIDLTRLGLDKSALPELLVAAERMGFTGLNITHPCKQEVLKFLDELSEETAEIGAANTVLFRAGKRVGHNTDGRAFVESFRTRMGDVPHDRIVLLGAGGAGTAIGHSLLKSLDTSIVVLDKVQENADALCKKLRKLYGSDRVTLRAVEELELALEGANGLINATPVGMDDCAGSVLPRHLMRSDLWISDIVYFPLDTELLRMARQAGCRVMDGGGMAIGQAAAAFEIFTGQKANMARMRRHFQELIGPAVIGKDKAVTAGE
jgi:shikimate dehydrogenase